MSDQGITQDDDFKFPRFITDMYVLKYEFHVWKKYIVIIINVNYTIMNFTKKSDQ